MRAVIVVAAIAKVAVALRRLEARLLVAAGLARLAAARWAEDRLRHRGHWAVELEILAVILVVGLLGEARLAVELRLSGCDDAEIVLGVLQIGLGQDRVARGLRVAGQLDVFLGDMGSRATDLHVGAVRLEGAVEVVRALAATAAATGAAIAPAHALLLSLPHGSGLVLHFGRAPTAPAVRQSAALPDRIVFDHRLRRRKIMLPPASCAVDPCRQIATLALADRNGRRLFVGAREHI